MPIIMITMPPITAKTCIARDSNLKLKEQIAAQKSQDASQI